MSPLPSGTPPLLTDFLRGVFHRLNNFIGPYYGKLDLILLFNKPEHRKLLSDADLVSLKAGLSMLSSLATHEDIFEFLAPHLLASPSAAPSETQQTVRALFLDSSGRAQHALAEARKDPALRDTINRFLAELSREIPPMAGSEAWTGPDGIHHRAIHLDLQAVIAAIRRLENKWFNLA